MLDSLTLAFYYGVIFEKHMDKTSIKDIEKVAYINVNAVDERMIPLQPCYHGDSKWEMWLSGNDGLVSAKVHGMSDGCYYSKMPANKSDVYIEFINLVMKRAYYKDIVHFESGILEDINNLSTSVTKINLFHDLWREDSNSISHRYVTTELEYIFKVCRSLFDLLQEVIKKIWARFRYIDQTLRTKTLKSTFSKMVLCNNKLSTAADISTRFQIPIQLAEFYERNGVFFNWLRSYRNEISHSGHNIKYLYIMEDGFAVPIDEKPFSDIDIWEHTEIKKNNLGSVRALTAYTILNTLNALQDFSQVIQLIMKLPEDISPDYNIFITGENIGILSQLHKYAEGDEWIKI